MEIRGMGRDRNQRIVPEIKGSYLIFHNGMGQDGSKRDGTMGRCGIGWDRIGWDGIDRFILEISIRDEVV